MSELKVCRICLNKNVKLFKLEQYNLKQYYEQIMLSKIQSIDGLPLYFCFQCAALLFKYHKFKEKCDYGQTILNQLLGNGLLSYNFIEDIRKNSTDFQPASDFINDLCRKRVRTLNFEHKPDPVPLEMENVILTSLTDEECFKYEYIPDYDNDLSISSIKCEEDVEKSAVGNNWDDELSISSLNCEKYADKSAVGNNWDDELSISSIKCKEDAETSEIGNNFHDEPSISSLNCEENAEKCEVGNNSVFQSSDLLTNLAHEDSTKTNKTVQNTEVTSPNEFRDFYFDLDNNDSSESGFAMDIDEDIVKVAHKDDIPLGEIKETQKQAAGKKVDKEKDPKKDPESTYNFWGLIREPRGELSKGNWETILLTEEEALEQFKRKEFDSKYKKSEFKCTKCFRGFSKNEMLLRHNKTAHEKGAIKCRFCHMQFKRKSQLKVHMMSHYCIYKCLRCGSQFYFKNGAVFHDEQHNGITRKCKYCGEEYTHRSSYYTHIRTSHRTAHACHICGATFVSQTGVALHMKRKHVITDESSMNVYCQKCEISFVSQSAYDEHLSQSELHEANDKEFKCPRRTRKQDATRCVHCNEKFKCIADVKSHLATEHPGQRQEEGLVCEICGIVLASAHILEIHMNRHTRKKVYPCQTCGKEFLCVASHNTHQLMHTGEKPHPCPVCPKRFGLKGHMEVHYKRVHLKEPYPKRSDNESPPNANFVQNATRNKTYNRKNRNRQSGQVSLFTSIPE